MEKRTEFEPDLELDPSQMEDLEEQCVDEVTKQLGKDYEPTNWWAKFKVIVVAETIAHGEKEG